MRHYWIDNRKEVNGRREQSVMVLMELYRFRGSTEESPKETVDSRELIYCRITAQGGVGSLRFTLCLAWSYRVVLIQFGEPTLSCFWYLYKAFDIFILHRKLSPRCFSHFTLNFTEMHVSFFPMRGLSIFKSLKWKILSGNRSKMTVKSRYRWSTSYWTTWNSLHPAPLDHSLSKPQKSLAERIHLQEL